MEDIELITSHIDIVLPTAWDIEGISPFIDIDSSGLIVNYTNPDNYEAAIVRANHPIPSQCGIFYFEIKIINKGKNGIIGIGYCTKQNNINIYPLGQEYKGNKQNKKNKSWWCDYHSDDGYFFCSESGKKYGPPYTTGDIVGCYLNFRNGIIFYTKNGINLGIACYLHSDFKGILYPCVGFKSQGGSVEANFGKKKFKYSALEYQEKAYFITGVNLTNELTKSLKKETSELSCRGKMYFIMGKYEEALADLTKLLETDPNNIIALRYRGEIYYLVKKYDESIADLEKLLTIRPDDEWATEAKKLVNDL
ncbi:concanavalin A-like lectin/glucanase domain-containing protein [Gigaspora rosea]|uniref:Concanavalin A-like lectin/glucanase domain-containing protein n=1 Tax=Gigaspora rosea TaxID=44941 RepID=A0A397VG98_9GLOM|nr:concanavalin A-like lectin/glucanase domain-containing protein [Gigaspora rosea]